MAIVFFFLYSPIAIMALFSFNASKSRTVWTGFTFDWYSKLFHNETIINSLGVTIIVAVIASVISTIDRKSTRLNSSHTDSSRMPSSA